jgi:hypothetical protein
LRRACPPRELRASVYLPEVLEGAAREFIVDPELSVGVIPSIKLPPRAGRFMIVPSEVIRLGRELLARELVTPLAPDELLRIGGRPFSTDQSGSPTRARRS